MGSSGKSQLGRDYFWNTASSLMGSLSMVLMLIVVTRAAGIAAAGVYSLATAVGQQFKTVGAYEVRPYQATDVRHRFSFGTYYATRLVTLVVMVVGIVAYALVTGKGQQSAIVVILVASLRVFDAFEDVFYGEFQRIGRLDIAGRANFFRVLVTTTVFTVLIFVTRDLATTTIVTIIVTALAVAFLIVPPAKGLFPLRPAFSVGPVRSLLIACLPLFLAAFLAMYLTNAPRFAIEAFMDSAQQGYYAILFMPALAINILAMFVFRPLLTRMATYWAAGNRAGFTRLVKRGILGVGLAFALTFIVVYFLGVPILNLLYSVDLSEYRRELLVIVVGGAMNSLAVIFYYALTTMRQQHLLLGGYLASAGLVWVLSRVLVPTSGIMGAALSYSLAMMVLALVFALSFMLMNRGAPRGVAQTPPKL